MTKRSFKKFELRQEPASVSLIKKLIRQSSRFRLRHSTADCLDVYRKQKKLKSYHPQCLIQTQKRNCASHTVATKMINGID